MWLSMLLLGLAQWPALHFRIAREVACPTEGQLEAALGAQLHGRSVVASSADAAPPRLTLSLVNGGLLVEFTSATGSAFERKLPDAACAELAQATALLADVWLRQGETAAADATGEGAPVARAVVGRPALAPEALPEPEASSIVSLRVSELAQLELRGAQVGAAAQAALGLDLGSKVGLAAEVELLADLTASDPAIAGAAIAVHRRAAALEVGYALGPRLEEGGSVWIGPELLWVDARAQGYPGNLAESVLVPGVRLGLRGTQPVNRWLFAFGGVNLAVSLSTPSFGSTVAGPVVVWTLPPVRLGLEAGLGLRL